MISMEKVTGIGGVFFKAKDPKALAKWYLDHLGITLTPGSYEQEPWRQEAGVTVFQPYSEESWKGQKEWMLNFRVRDLGAMVEQLRAAGIEVKVDPEEYPNGRFAHITDPEGNPIELWQLMGRETSQQHHNRYATRCTKLYQGTAELANPVSP